MNRWDNTVAHTAETALARLEEIDSLLSNDLTGDQIVLAQYLHSTKDLDNTLQKHDQELLDMCNLFVEAHVEQADNICRIYNEFCECENKLVHFETEIVSFQRKLEENTDDIVLMQQQTDVLVRSVNNRRMVSAKLNEVYSVLQECDSFCDGIANKDVDQSYLANLRELSRKLSFFSRNKVLQHSAVDNEIRPKLTAAAKKAGDKLQRFLARQISDLANDPAKLEENQDALFMNSGFAYTFLQSYNEPVARELSKLYIRILSTVYVKRLQHVFHDFSESSAIHANPLEPLVTAEELSEFLSNRDTSSPSGNQVTLPPAKGFPGRILNTTRDRSVSQHMRTLSDMTKTDTLRSLRAGTFHDTMRAVSSLRVRHGNLQSDRAISASLDTCNSWTWQLVKCLRIVVNACTAECRFISNFFFSADELAGQEDLSNAECMARAVLGKALQVVELAIQEDLPKVMDRTAVLAALRAIELVKQYLCTSQDPIPLLLLSGVLEISKGTLRGNLRSALRNDEAVLEYLTTVKFCPFRKAAGKRSTALQITQDRPYADSLGPNALIQRVGEILGQLALLNTAPFRCSTFGEAADAVYDPLVAAFVSNALKHLLSFTELLASRHPSLLGRQIFSVVNDFCVESMWRRLASDFLSIAESSTLSSPQLAPGGAGGPEDELLSPVGTPAQPSAATASSSTAVTAVYREDAVYFATAADIHLLDAHLGKWISQWATHDAEVTSKPSALLTYVGSMEQLLGTSFFENAATPLQPPAPGASPPPGVTESAALAVATEFNSNWQEYLRRLLRETRGVSRAAMRAVTTQSESIALAQYNCEELVQTVLQGQLQCILEANSKLSAVAGTFFQSNTVLQSKLVSNTTVLLVAKGLLNDRNA